MHSYSVESVLANFMSLSSLVSSFSSLLWHIKSDSQCMFVLVWLTYTPYTQHWLILLFFKYLKLLIQFAFYSLTHFHFCLASETFYSRLLFDAFLFCFFSLCFFIAVNWVAVVCFRYLCSTVDSQAYDFCVPILLNVQALCTFCIFFLCYGYYDYYIYLYSSLVCCIFLLFLFYQCCLF